MKRAYDEDLVGCWKISERNGDELITRWVDRDGVIVKTEREKVGNNAK